MVMRILANKVRGICAGQGRTIGDVLKQAGVSRNAFYTLARRKSVVPKSIHAIAAELQVPVSTLLDDVPGPDVRMKSLIRETQSILKRHPDAEFDNVRHTLILLEEKPVDRLRRALLRGQHIAIR